MRYRTLDTKATSAHREDRAHARVESNAAAHAPGPAKPGGDGPTGTLIIGSDEPEKISAGLVVLIPVSFQELEVLRRQDVLPLRNVWELRAVLAERVLAAAEKISRRVSR